MKTIADLARYLGINRGTVRDWLSEGYRATRTAASMSRPLNSGTPSAGAWVARILWRGALAGSVRTPCAPSVSWRFAAGLFVPIDEHRSQRLAIIDSFCSALEQMPSKLAPLLAGAGSHDEIVRQLHAYARSVRIQVAAKHSPPVAEVDAE